METRRCSRVFALVLLLIAFLGTVAPAHAAVLSGKMRWWQQMVGLWSCEVTIQPTPRARQQAVFTAIGSVAPYNVFEWEDIAPQFHGMQYDGYSTSQKAWWETQADSTGYAILLHSSNGYRYDQISLPASIERDHSLYREMYRISRDGSFHEDAERLINGSWHAYSTSYCTRRTQRQR